MKEEEKQEQEGERKRRGGRKENGDVKTGAHIEHLLSRCHALPWAFHTHGLNMAWEWTQGLTCSAALETWHLLGIADGGSTSGTLGSMSTARVSVPLPRSLGTGLFTGPW